MTDSLDRLFAAVQEAQGPKPFRVPHVQAVP